MHQDTAHKNRRARTLAILALVVTLATVMVPYFGPAARQAAEKTIATIAQAPLTDLPPATPACAMGDQYYEWARAASLAQTAQEVVKARVSTDRPEERLAVR